jgi:hypothetical protein
MSKTKTKIERIDGKHPLVAVCNKHTGLAVARAIGHKTHATVSIYRGRAAKKPNLRVPAEWVLPMCRLSGLRPAQIRPDLYEPKWQLTA